MKVELHDPRALDELRLALIKFQNEVSASLAEIDSDLKRWIDFLESTRVPELRKQIPRLREAVVLAKSQLARKQMNAAALKISPSTVDEKVAISNAQNRLEQQEVLLKRTSKWVRRLEENYNAYKSHIATLGTAIDRDVPNAIQQLKHMAGAIEAYLSLSPQASPEQRRNALASVQTVLRDGVSEPSIEQAPADPASPADPPSESPALPVQPEISEKAGEK